MKMEVEKCPHGVWHPHNALLLEDGSSVPDPGGECPGGKLTTEGRTFGVSHGLAQYLRELESVLSKSIPEQGDNE